MKVSKEGLPLSRKYIVGFDLLVKNKRFCAVYAHIPIPRSQRQYKFENNSLPVKNSPLLLFMAHF